MSCICNEENEVYLGAEGFSRCFSAQAPTASGRALSVVQQFVADRRLCSMHPVHMLCLQLAFFGNRETKNLNEEEFALNGRPTSHCSNMKDAEYPQPSYGILGQKPFEVQ